jgi:hypothetical protein
MGGKAQMGKDLAIGGRSAVPGGKLLDRRQDALAERAVWGRMPSGVGQALWFGCRSILMIH